MRRLRARGNEVTMSEVMRKALELARHQLQGYTGNRCPFFCPYCGDKKRHNALAQADAACGVSPGAMGCASNGDTEDE